MPSDPYAEDRHDSAPPPPARHESRSDVALLLKWLAALLLAYGGVTAYRHFTARPVDKNADRSTASASTADKKSPFQVQYVSPETYVERPVVVPGPGAIVLPRTLDDPLPAFDDAESDYVVAETCRECHAEQYESFQKTAHAQTLRAADSNTVLGSFEAGQNVLATSEPRLRFLLEREPDGMFQKVVVDAPDSQEKFEWRQRIDLVSGSGRLGQTYLSWIGDQLFQLPVSYFTDQACWTNSPGYMDGVADFARPAVARCLECHATYVRQLPGANNRYDPKSLIPGVTCQRCHGAGREHVEFHRAHPAADKPHAIVNPSELSRERQMQVCEQCHSGKSTLLRPPFSYRPGEPLEDHLSISPQGRDIRGQVHTANQSARIALSRCFQASDRMTCMTCHDPHRFERGDMASFSAKCLECHQADRCPQAPRKPDNCIDCHMPRGHETDSGITKGGGAAVSPALRDHWIKVWKEPNAAPSNPPR